MEKEPEKPRLILRLAKSTFRITITVFFILSAGTFYLMQPLVSRGSATQASGWIDSKDLENHVVALAKIDRGRHSKNLTGTKAASDYILKILENNGNSPTLQPVKIEDFAPCSNISVVFPGTLTERVIIGAHFDTYGPFPGADDNASGVAALLEMAKVLKGKTTKHTVELVFYCFEEPPAFRTKKMGSHIHAESVAPENVELMISVEMIGYFSQKPKSQSFPHPAMALVYGDAANFIAVVGLPGDAMLIRNLKSHLKTHAKTIDVKSMNAPRKMPGLDFSDHLNYWDRDISAVMVTDTSFYRNDNYHTVYDTPDTLDYGRMREVTNGLVEIALSY